jgi:hypothetical protein
MAIGEAVDTKPVDLVPKVLARITIAISETNLSGTVEISNPLFRVQAIAKQWISVSGWNWTKSKRGISLISAHLKW